MAERGVTVMCYWGGNILEGTQGLCYDIRPRQCIKLKRGTNYSQLLDKMYCITELDRAQFRLRLTCRFPTIVGQHMIDYLPLQIVDDDSVEAMLDVVADHQELSSVDLYLESEPINRGCALTRTTTIEAEGRQLVEPGPIDGTTTIEAEARQLVETGSIDGTTTIEAEVRQLVETGSIDGTTTIEAEVRQLVEPGPIDGSVLTLQSEHRSSAIWDGQDLPPLQCRRSDGALRRQTLDLRVQNYLLQAGFYGVYKVGFIQLDWALITALVERWRVETHTFHLPVGECSITLQDVAVLLGIPVEGNPVTGRDSIRTVAVCQALCQELLGVAPAPSDLNGSRLKLRWLAAQFGVLPDDADDLIIQRHARAYILQLIGGSLFADKSQNKVKIMFLPCLRDFEAAGRFSWGSAILACLYREMCRATRPGASDIGGPLILLQLWAWERLSHIRPERLVPRVQPPPAASEVQTDVELVAPIVDAQVEDVPAGNRSLPAGPLGCRWRAIFSLRDTPTHVLRYYRDQLDQMRDHQMIWQPYTEDVIAELPPYCLVGHDIWRTVSPLICFDIVEWHFPDRVLRQFGIKQGIPVACDTSRELHATDRRGRSDYDWEEVHRLFVERWGQRHVHIAGGDPVDGLMEYKDPYFVWYRRITRRFVGPPGARPLVGFQPVGSIIELLAHSLTSIYHRSEETIDDDSAAQHVLQDIKQISYTALEAIREHQRLTVHPAPDTPAPVPIPVPPLTRPRGIVVRSTVQRTRRGKQSRGATDESQGGTSTPIPSPSTSVPSTSSAPTPVPPLHAPSPLPQQFQELPTPPLQQYEDSPTSAQQSHESPMPTTTVVAQSTTSTVDSIPVVSSHDTPPVSHLTEATPPLDAPEASLREHKVAEDGLAQLQHGGRGRGRGRGNGFNPVKVPRTPSTKRARKLTPSLPPGEGASQITQEPRSKPRQQRPKPRQQKPKRQRIGTA